MSIHAVANGTGHCFLWLSSMPLCMYTPCLLSIHLWMDTWVALISWLLVIKLPRALGCRYLCECVFLVYFGCLPTSRIAGPMVAQFVVLVESAKLIFTVATSTSLHLSVVEVFPLLHILASICSLCSFC